jgi:hypothetical protein
MLFQITDIVFIKLNHGRGQSKYSNSVYLFMSEEAPGAAHDGYTNNAGAIDDSF